MLFKADLNDHRVNEDGGLVLKLKLSKVEIEEDEDIFEWFYTSAQKNRLLPAV